MTPRESNTGWRTVGRPAGNELPAPRPRTRFRKHRSVPIAVNIAPMIDVTFLLLIFFLVTTTFGRPEGILASKLPSDTGAPTVALPLAPIVVRLSPAGSDGCRIDIDNYSTVPEDFEQLAVCLMEIQKLPGFDSETPVVIKANDDVQWDHVVNAWNAAVRCEFTNVAFSDSGGSP